MLTFEQKIFAYDKYTFNSNIQTILDFMTPVSKLDEKIEEFKSKDQNLLVTQLFSILWQE